jgi:glutaredoxin
VAALTFVTRAGCTMCAEAQPAVERAAAAAGVPVTVVDVDSDPGLAQWSDHVPVVLLDDAVHSRWWVDEAQLRAALGAPRR